MKDKDKYKVVNSNSKKDDGTKTSTLVIGCAASHDDNANVSVARESVKRIGERVTHLFIEIDAPCAAQCNDRNSIGYSCRQNIGVHWHCLDNTPFEQH
jgi:hypothetical protein